MSGGALARCMCSLVQPFTLPYPAIKIAAIFDKIGSGVIHVVLTQTRLLYMYYKDIID